MNRMYTLIQFVNHIRTSRRWDAFHSPYLFNLFTHCCDESVVFPLFQELEQIRQEWKKSPETILRKDLGAGSVFDQTEASARLSFIAKNALSLPFQCRFMSRLADFLKPSHIIEFGTSLGLSSAYLSAGAPAANIDTVEGDPEIVARAKGLYENLGLKNINVHQNSFNDFTSRYNTAEGKIDLLFLDGDHRMEATMISFNALKNHFLESTVVVVDDIYWSQDMQVCWKKLVSLPEVKQSVDCFHFGLLFFNTNFKNKESHVIRLPLKMMIR